MFLTRLRVSNFRNLAPQEITFDNRVTVITGKNGQGKTSLLETVYLLSHNRSFRSGKTKDLLQWTAGPARERVEGAVEATVSSSSGDRLIQYFLRGNHREVFVNEKRVEKLSHFYGQLNSVIFTPEELQLVKGAPQQRRNFVDRSLAMVDPVFVEAAVQYQRALKQRNALLGQLQQTKAPASEAVSQLGFWDALLVKHGHIAAGRRRQFIAALGEKVPNYYRALVSTTRLVRALERVSLRYTSDFLDESGEILPTPKLEELFAAEHLRDLRRGVTSVGFHRDDVEIFLETDFGAKPAKIAASQGQARSVSLALSLSAVDYLNERTGEPPVMLLDDVESELDQYRRAALFELLSTFQAQVLLTTTEPTSAVKSFGSTTGFLAIEGGQVSADRDPKFPQ
ncbi:MAG: DNA replication/repair protein RecF [Bdellovibrionota bacterium]